MVEAVNHLRKVLKDHRKHRMRVMSGNNDYINLIIFLLDDIKSYCARAGLTFVGFCVMKRNYSLDFMYQ